MKDEECISFLQWALPRLQMRWSGFRKVRKRVCKRITRRLDTLALSDCDAYRHYLYSHREEWRTLDNICQVVVSRFYRDKLVFEALIGNVLPNLANARLAGGEDTLTGWSIGSASGEEPYTLAILWRDLLAEQFPSMRLAILGTEVNEQLLQRSAQACYPASTIKNLPAELRTSAFTQQGGLCCLKPDYKAMVTFHQEDIRTSFPEQQFDLIFCRNLVFTYYAEDLQRNLLDRLLSRLRAGGYLVLGLRENLPVSSTRLTAVDLRLGLYQSNG